MKMRKKGLEVILGSIFGIASLVLPFSNVKANILDSVNNNAIEIVTTSPQIIDKATISEYWTAWSTNGNIFVKNRATNIQYQITNSGSAQNPNLDSIFGNDLVYDDDGIIHKYNLDSMNDEIIYSGLEVCSYPKINGINIVFHVENGLGEEIWAYNLVEEMIYPISNSNNPKQAPDIFGKYVTWPEDEDNICYEEVTKYSTKIYDLELGKEFTVGHNFVTGDIESVGIYNNKIVGVASSINWDNGPASLIIYDLSYCDGEVNPSNICVNTGIVHSQHGKKGEVAVYENLMVWTELMTNRIMGVDLNSQMSLDQFLIADTGDCHSPDVYVDEDGTVNVIYMSNNSPVVKNFLMNSMNTKSSRFNSKNIKNLEFNSMNTESSINQNYLIKTEIIPYPGPSECGNRGTVYLSGDVNKDCYVNLEDCVIVFDNWLKTGLTNIWYRDGDVNNFDPNNVVEYCEVGPETHLSNGKRINLDYDGDCSVRIGEFSIIANNWMNCSDPVNSNCDVYWRMD